RGLEGASPARSADLPADRSQGDLPGHLEGGVREDAPDPRADDLQGEARPEEPALLDQPHARDAARWTFAARAEDLGACEAPEAARDAPLDLHRLAQLHPRRVEQAAAHDAGDGDGRRDRAL